MTVRNKISELINEEISPPITMTEPIILIWCAYFFCCAVGEKSFCLLFSFEEPDNMLGCFWAMQPHKIIIPPMLTERESKSMLMSHIC